MKKRQYIVNFISSMILLLLFYAAISKITDYERFENTLRMSPLLEKHSRFVAIALPTIEIAITILLFIPRYRITGLCAAAILLTLFTAYLIYMILVSPHLPCSCGGLFRKMTWRQHVAFNTVFICLSLSGIYLHRKLFVQTPP